MTKPRYAIVDRNRKKFLSAIQTPESGACVTQWTRKPNLAMRFQGIKSALRLARRLEERAADTIVIVNARNEVVLEV